MHCPWLSKSRVSRLSRAQPFLTPPGSDCDRAISEKRIIERLIKYFEAARWQKFRFFPDLILLPLKFVSLTLRLEYSPTNRVLGFFLLRVQQIFCLLTGHEQRLSNRVRFLQLLVGQQLKLLAVLQPAVVSARIPRNAQRIDLISDARAVLVQCHLLAINVFSLALIVDIDLQLKTHFDQFVQLAPGCESRWRRDKKTIFKRRNWSIWRNESNAKSTFLIALKN